MPKPRKRPDTRASIVQEILTWYSRKGRNLPWRNISNPYRILISEIMLQQTQVSRVLNAYPAFLRKFPTLASLAGAERRDVVTAWRGMGYNNRAVRLHLLAREVMAHHGGRFPESFDLLKSLPGIGTYTANAFLASALGKQVAAIDVNARRFLSRRFRRMQSSAQLAPEKAIDRLASGIIPRGRAYEWNQAVMDLGAMVCTARRPACPSCPVRARCPSKGAMALPTASPRPREKTIDGLPQRIYRGRVIEVLRNAERGMTIERLGRRIHATFSPRHHSWMKTMLAGLQKDGLIAIRGGRSLRSQQVTLA